MLKFSKAAVIIAVFLLTATSGCYTKLKSTEVKIVPDSPDQIYEEQEYDGPDWNFGYGWYNPGWGYDNSYYYYYHVNWWDECRWCGSDDGNPDIELFENTKKIPHRSDPYLPSGATAGGTGGTVTPSVQVKPTTPTTDPGTSTPIVQPKSETSNKNNGNNNKSDSNKKTKKRRR